MGKIKRLPDEVINQIAAGEVVERPSAVVKELMENAVDAGATHVEVSVEHDGERISVVDNGCGMTEGDALLALERHATSKIEKFEDLLGIHSYGFRGEALPSIAAVSLLTLKTRTADARQGIRFSVKEGRLISKEPCGMSVGTSLMVEDLFANVPARKKFLKSPVTEFGHIALTFKQMAMVRPDVHFVLKKDGKVLLNCTIQSEEERVLQLVQKEIIQRLSIEKGGRAVIPFDHVAGMFRVRGFLGAPILASTLSKNFFIFVNSRPIWDHRIKRGVADAYGTMIERQKSPLSVLFIEIPPYLVDINVHPAKREVRFSEEVKIYQLVYGGVRRALQESVWRQSALNEERGWSARGVRSLRENESEAGWKEGLLARESAESSLFRAYSPDILKSEKGEGDARRSPASSACAGDLHFAAGNDGEGGPFLEFRIVGQIARRYIACEKGEFLFLIDQHAAHEHVFFEKFKASWKKSAGEGVPSQYLLTPLLCELSLEEREVVKTYSDLFKGIGFDLEELSGGTLSIRAVPASLIQREISQVFLDLLQTCMEKGGERSIEEVLDPILATLACHSAVRFGESMTEVEMHALLAQLDEVGGPFFCPHGRPIFVEIPFSDIDRRLKRL
ncbi:MAG: DNA mismatch repair endonuclease MutL [Deltaproteobacteria bacterium]|nr:DNA mismatch repair endonuclease MutL [Deltaproteobacteria bacterium]